MQAIARIPGGTLALYILRQYKVLIPKNLVRVLVKETVKNAQLHLLNIEGFGTKKSLLRIDFINHENKAGNLLSTF